MYESPSKATYCYDCNDKHEHEVACSRAKGEAQKHCDFVVNHGFLQSKIMIVKCLLYMRRRARQALGSCELRLTVSHQCAVC